MSTFLTMGGYAGFVWPCYLLTVLAMAWIGVSSWQRTRKLTKQLNEMTGGETHDTD